MSVWRELLRRSAELLDQNGHAEIDATHFDHQQASIHYLKRTARTVRTIQATFPIAPYDHAHNARIDDERYHQRSMTESVNSSLKRSSCDNREEGVNSF